MQSCPGYSCHSLGPAAVSLLTCSFPDVPGSPRPLSLYRSCSLCLGLPSLSLLPGKGHCFLDDRNVGNFTLICILFSNHWAYICLIRKEDNTHFVLRNKYFDLKKTRQFVTWRGNTLSQYVSNFSDQGVLKRIPWRGWKKCSFPGSGGPRVAQQPQWFRGQPGLRLQTSEMSSGSCQHSGKGRG